MSGLALRVVSVVTTLLVLTGSWSYAATHVKNVKAPLQPPVVEEEVAVVAPAPSASPRASASQVPSLLPVRPGIRRPSGSPGAIFTLQPGVQSTELPKITITHVS